jgi:hypothetical protein
MFAKAIGRSATFVLLALLPACGSVTGKPDGGTGDAPRTDGALTDSEGASTDAPRRGDSAVTHGTAGAGDAATAAGTAGTVGTAGTAGSTGSDAAVTGSAGGTGDAAADLATTACRQTPVALGTAANFAVLAGATITNTGLTTVTGDVGVSPGTAITGFPPGATVGIQHAGDPTAAQAEADLKTAFDDAAGRTLCSVMVVGNLGGKTLSPGLYTSTTSLEISAGDLTLDARGDPDAVFIFQMTTTLTTTADRQVILSGSAKAANVFWQVGTSATLGSGSTFAGTIMAAQSITVVTGTKVQGRLLARTAATTLDSDTVAKP